MRMAKCWVFNGDAVETLRSFPCQSVQMCVTSPPYFGLRDYGTARWTGGSADCDHIEMATGMSAKNTLGPARHLPHTNAANVGRVRQFKTLCKKCGAKRMDNQIGLEQTLEEYVERLVEVFREVKRVLRDDGTLWLNLGDCFNGSSTRTNTGFNERWGNASGGKQQEQERVTPVRNTTGLKPKDLMGMPWRVAFALQSDGWYLRSDIIWAKNNCMPESVTDRPTRSHEYIFLLTKSPKYFYDSEAIKEDGVIKAGTKGAKGSKERFETPGVNSRPPEYKVYDGRRNKRSVWVVNTRPFLGAHFAVFPSVLVQPCILAGASEAGCCDRCGASWRRVNERTGAVQTREPAHVPGNCATKVDSAGWQPMTRATDQWERTCQCDSDTVPCTVLDPFAGSGTTGEVALKHGRNAVLIELNPAYCNLIEKRVGVENIIRGQK